MNLSSPNASHAASTRQLRPFRRGVHALTLLAILVSNLPVHAVTPVGKPAALACPLPPQWIKSEDDASKRAYQAMQAYRLTSLAPECVQFFVDVPGKRGADYEVEARENHQGRCGGDPATSPKIFALKIRANGQIKLYNAAEAEYEEARCPLARK